MDQTKTSLYDDDDFFGWATEQADLLRQSRLAEADLANLAEEIETLWRSEKRALGSAYRLICLHLLKLLFQPNRATRSWLGTIVRERSTAAGVIADSPSLERQRDALFLAACKQARKEAAAETGLPLSTFPETAPFSLDQMTEDGFLPAPTAVGRPPLTIDRNPDAD